MRPIPQQDVARLWTYFFVEPASDWARDAARHVELAVFADRTSLLLSHSTPRYAQAMYANQLRSTGQLVLSGAITFKQMFDQPPAQCTLDMPDGRHVYIIPFITYQRAHDDRQEVNSIVALYGDGLINVVAFEFDNLSKVGWDDLQSNLPS